jgi:radical SAM protein with 4Fe4S-binding SPASM domain
LAEILGEKFRAYRALWERARARLERPAFPIHVDYEILSRCNLRCPICLMSARGAGESPAESLSLAEVLGFIDEGAEEGQRSMGFGGLWEPLLFPSLPETVAYGRDKGLVDAHLNTNGTLLTRAKARDLIEAGLTRLMISVDAATEETYRVARPGGSFTELTENIEAFLSERASRRSPTPLLRLSFCRASFNEKELCAFWRRWEGKADYFSVQRYGHFGEGTAPLFPATELGEPPQNACSQPWKRLLVRHDGSALPCCDLSASRYPVGDARVSSLKSIWDGARARAAREIAADGASALSPCRECRAKHAPPRSAPSLGLSQSDP